ncbi:MAG: hypothetical protein MK289_21990 [Trichodesmium sp. ALOHA_ZT_67]|nr:hypothetical protein [Trichodesmium sp. ALOHA_ZT_67]MDT9341454.1 hypothetical protein [Trichodesmium erythraeum 21-75]
MKPRSKGGDNTLKNK